MTAEVELINERVRKMQKLMAKNEAMSALLQAEEEIARLKQEREAFIAGDGGNDGAKTSAALDEAKVVAGAELSALKAQLVEAAAVNSKQEKELAARMQIHTLPRDRSSDPPAPPLVDAQVCKLAAYGPDQYGLA